jgi:peptide/nickel transport system permease protein
VLTAAIYIEHVYLFNGLGTLAFQTLQADRGAYDLPLVTAIFVLVAAVIVVVNLLADLVQAWLDPRVRLEKQAVR